MIPRMVSFALLLLSATLSIFSCDVLAKDFQLPVLPTFQNSYDLAAYSGKTSYYDLMKGTIEPKMVSIANEATQDNEGALKAGKGVQVKLGEHNYNIHVNFLHD